MTHPDLVDLVERGGTPDVRDHLESCPSCRARAALVGGLGEGDADALPGIDQARRGMAAARDQASRTMSMGSGPPDDEPVLASGRDLGRYAVEGWIGRGGMGSVYRVRHRELGSVHALKILRGTTGSERVRLIREGRAQGVVRHPNLVAVTDVVEVDGVPGLVMELVEGPSLQAWLREHGRPGAEVADRLGRQILRAVAAAHHAGLVHRDLKPANVLLAPSDEGPVAKVTDFGLARSVAGPGAEETPLTRPGTPLGTPAYMAPEQIRDASLADARSDVFALGAVLYELCSGVRAFPGTQAIDVWDAIRAGRRQPLARVAPGLPRALCDTVERALAVDPADRFADAAAMLASWRGDGAPAPRRTALPWVAAGLATVVVVVGAFLATRQPTTSKAPDPQATERRLTALPAELQTFAIALSADGRRFATTDSRGLFVQDYEGGPQRRVLDQGPYHSVDFFPSGERLLASGVRDGHEAVWAVNVDGTGLELVLDTEARTAALSPDGRRLAWVSDSGLWAADLESGERTRLRPLNGTDSALELAWSPSGRTVAAIQRATSGKGAWLELTAADGSSSRRLLVDSRLVSLGLGPLAWVGEDRLVYALSSEGRTPGASLYALDGAEQATSTEGAVQLRSFEGSFLTQVRGSADGSRLIVARITGAMQPWLARLDDGSSPARMSQEDWEELPLGWVDDQHLLLYSLRPDPSLAVRDLGAGVTTVLRASPVERRILHDGALYDWRVEDWKTDPWTLRLTRESLDDGASTVFATRTAHAGAGMDRFAVRCGRDRCLASEPGDDEIVFRWLSADGSLGEVARRVPVATRSMTWDLSPDGEQLAVLTADPGAVQVWPMAGGEPTSVPVDLTVAVAVSWKVTGDGWFVAGLYDPSDHPYRVVDLARDGTSRLLWSSMSWYLYAPTPSPDGRTLAMAAYTFDDDVWGLDLVPPS